MGAIENKKLLQHIFTELSKGNPQPFIDSMADDFRWVVTGNTKWSKTYEGKQAILTDLFGALRSKVGDSLKTVADRYIAEDDLVVVEARGSSTTNEGIPYNNTYCFIFRVTDGKLQEVTEYMDTELVTATLGDPS